MVVGSTQLAAAQGITSDPEAERKADLVTAYKILVNENILDSFGHVSVRSARDPNIFLMPRAMPPSLVSQDDILALRVSDSQPLEPKGRRVNGERYIHGEIYKARAGRHVRHPFAFAIGDPAQPDLDQAAARGGAGGLPAAGNSNIRDP